MKIIIISGTPGCGKTSVAKELSKLIGAEILSLNELAVSDEFSFEYDNERKTYIVDFKIFLPSVLKKIKVLKKNNPRFLIIESHFSDIIPRKYIDYIFVLRCDPDELTKRLQKKNFDTKKLTENIQSEILGNCVNYLIEKKIKNPIYEIDTTDLDIKSVANIINDIVFAKIEVDKYYLGEVDWLEKLYQEDRLTEFFE